MVSPDRMHAIDIETQHVEEDEGTVEADQIQMKDDLNGRSESMISLMTMA